MKLKKTLALLLVLTMLVGVLAACGGGNASGGQSSGGQSSSAAPEKDFKDFTLADWDAYADQLHQEGKDKYKILYLVSWAASEYYVNSYEAWKELYAEYGWEIDMQGPKEYTAESQLSVLEAALVSQAYDAIILYPIDGNAFAAVKDDFWETYHTPIIIWGMAAKSNAGQYFVMGGDRYRLEGYLMAEMALEYVDANWDYFKKYEGTGIPTFIAEQSYNPDQNVRLDGVKEKLAADGRFKIVLDEENVRDPEAIQYAEAMILNHPEVEIGFLYVDMLSVGYDTAVKAATTKLSDHFAMFSSNAIHAVQKLMIEDGDKCNIKGSVLSNHRFVGELLARCIRDGVPAAEHGIIIEGLSDEQAAAFSSGESAFKVTPANVRDFYKE